MLTIAFAQQASGMLATSLVDVSMLSAGIVRRKDVSVNKCPQPKDQNKIATNKKTFLEHKQSS